MHKFIALQKIPRAQTLGLTAVSIEHKRANLVKDAPHSERAKALTGIGLRQIRPEERVPELQYGFQRLGYVGAYVVNAPSDSSLERNIDNRSLYAKMSGTSMATPYVTGIAALIASANPGLQGNTLRQQLTSRAMPLGAPPERVGVGLARFT